MPSIMQKLLIILILSNLLNANWNNNLFNIPMFSNNSDENSSAKAKRLHKEHFNDIWEDVIDNLEDGLDISKKIDKAPNRAIFIDDKKSLRKKFDNVLDNIIILLLEDNLLNYRKQIRDAKSDINSLEKDILEYREKKITAPDESHLKTTKSEYNQKISDIQSKINEQKQSIVNTKLLVSSNLKNMGINLSAEQIDVLLSRVDGDDIIAMTLMMDVLKQITTQLMGIMQESSEELNHAKKYYGMNMVLLELVVYIQDNLIKKVEQKYIPKIDNILLNTRNILLKTSKKISSENNLQRKSIYNQNYKAQKLTFKVAKLYKKNLQDELKQIRKARDISIKNLDVSKNTFETVSLSSDLYKIISSSQNIMREVMKLQIPDIIPFKNIQMRDKFMELTDKIKEE
ncbi:hypothetical protein MNB_SV-9-118 [hydrothermal vent metagenome]|uniref:Uncharacterized protein n=1 Tax=hydrothermal vent metagenome TaxID=652676 RepID=A0A1W1BRT8_9ZZZZ